MFIIRLVLKKWGNTHPNHSVYLQDQALRYMGKFAATMLKPWWNTNLEKKRKVEVPWKWEVTRKNMVDRRKKTWQIIVEHTMQGN